MYLRKPNNPWRSLISFADNVNILTGSQLELALSAQNNGCVNLNLAVR